MNANIFTDEEIDFINKHGLSSDDFYDGRDESQIERRNRAKANGCNFVIGPLCRYEHRLRTRSGHCIICNPGAIAFQRRHDRSGLIYVAKNDEYTKIGVVDNNIHSAEESIHNREIRLNSEGGYGGETGWRIIAWAHVNEKVGRIEELAHKALSDYSIKEDYIYSGELRTAKELFICTPREAIETINTLVAVRWVYPETRQI